MNDVAQGYRRSVTPGAPVSTRSQKRLQDLRCDPLGRLVLQLSEIDVEIESIRQTPRPSRMVIATLMALKYNVLKSLMPYAYSMVPSEENNGGGSKVPVIINIDGAAIAEEEKDLLNNINDALEEARVTFPSYTEQPPPPIKGTGWRSV